MTHKKGDRVYIVVRCGPLGTRRSADTFVDELVILDEHTARCERLKANLIIHGVALYGSRSEAQRIAIAEPALGGVAPRLAVHGARLTAHGAPRLP